MNNILFNGFDSIHVGSATGGMIEGELTMDRIGELIRALSDREVMMRSYVARVNHTCKICEKPATSFRTHFAEIEYTISAICQACQDYYLLDRTGG